MVDATLALPADTRLMILAPVVRDRKGEFADLFADMQAQGYVRFRVDGKTVEAADVPKLKKAEKHDIDVVIDRIRVQPGIEQRLAESYEAALRIADGRALAVELDSAPSAIPAARPRRTGRASVLEQVLLPALRLLAVRARAAPVLVQLAGRRLPDLRRPRRDHGVRRRPGGRLSLAQPGERRGQGLGPAQRLHLLAARERRRATTASTSTPPFEELPESAREVLLRGSGSEEIEFVYEAEGARGKTRQVKRKHPFEGILPNLERRFKETDSVAVREDLMRYQSAKPCPDCHGARLRIEARNVFLVDARQRRARADLPHRALHPAREPGLVPGARPRTAPRPRSPTR